MQDKSEIEAALVDEVRALRVEVRRLNEQRYFRIESSLRQVALWTLVRGLAWGLGSVLGATILLSILIRTLSSIDFIPVLGDWAQQIIQQIEHTPFDPPAE
jgi:hypothetical protein